MSEVFQKRYERRGKISGARVFAETCPGICFTWFVHFRVRQHLGDHLENEVDNEKHTKATDVDSEQADVAFIEVRV